AGVSLCHAAATRRDHQGHGRPAPNLDRHLLRHHLADHPRRTGRRDRALADLDLPGDDGLLPLRVRRCACGAARRHADAAQRSLSDRDAAKYGAMKRARPATTLLTYAVALVLIVFVGFPLLWMVLSSFKPSAELFVNPPRILPRAITFEWY